MDRFFCKIKLKNKGKKWAITTINDLILSLYKIKTLKQLNKNFWNSFRKVLYSWVNYINKKYVIRIVWNETLHTVLCHIHVFVFMNKWHMSFFLYIIYKALFFPMSFCRKPINRYAHSSPKTFCFTISDNVL
jgi:hypothetical protein